MKRRDFISTGALASAGLSSFLSGCRPTPPPRKMAAPPAVNTATDFELNEESVSSLQQKMAAGKYSSEQLTSLYLKRIADSDKKGPVLNAVIEINSDATAIAKAMDAERKAVKVRGPLQ